MQQAISELIQRLGSRDNSAPGDYIDDEGFRMCGKCHTRKQVLVCSEAFGEKKMPCTCKCRQDEIQAEDKEMQKARQKVLIHRLRREGLTDPAYYRCTFERDDRRHAAISDACRKYADAWPEMRENNVGLLFYGGVGTGKSFYACCIANALLDQGVSVLVTSFPRILAKIQSGKFGDELQWVLDMIESCSLVIIDDLGAERCSDYAMEQIFNVIDTRSRCGKPLIVTTNLTPSDFKNPDIAHQRIFDRILERAVKIKMAGSSRRSESQTQVQEEYARRLGVV